MENISFSPKKRETYTTYETDGRKFKINAFDPMSGNYILMQIISCVLPLGITDALKEQIPGSESAMKVANSGNKMISKQEFISLQTDILSTVEEYLRGGNTSPVVRENGTYGVEDVTSMLCLKLIIASLTFNYKDFFKEFPSLDTFTKA
nr:MAG TPA: tail assembly chaperone protein [Caudoviricetes sp.]